MEATLHTIEFAWEVEISQVSRKKVGFCRIFFRFSAGQASPPGDNKVLASGIRPAGRRQSAANRSETLSASSWAKEPWLRLCRPGSRSSFHIGENEPREQREDH